MIRHSRKVCILLVLGLLPGLVLAQTSAASRGTIRPVIQPVLVKTTPSSRTTRSSPSTTRSLSSTQAPPTTRLSSELSRLVAIPAIPGYESELSSEIRGKLMAFRPTVDNLGDVIVTLGSGSPRRLIVTPIDEPGFVVSEITREGYLRLQRLPRTTQTGLPGVFNELYAAQPVKVETASGKWIDGVVAGLSVHLQPGRTGAPKASDIENMYVDIGAKSPSEARGAGVDALSPVVLTRQLQNLNGRIYAGDAVGDRFGAATLIDLLESVHPEKINGTLTIAFVVQQWFGAHGLERILQVANPDQMVYVGRLLPGGAVAGVEGIRRAPRREPGSGVLLGLPQSNGMPVGLAATLKEIADAHQIALSTDFSSSVVPEADSTLIASSKWAHLGIATAWADTPAEEIDARDLDQIESLLQGFVEGSSAVTPSRPPIPESATPSPKPSAEESSTEILESLVPVYGPSGHEEPVRDIIKKLLPAWAKPETDESGNLIVRAGTNAGVSTRPRLLFVAHMDEIGFQVQSISKDGRLEAATLGGMDFSFYQGHPALVHTSDGDRAAVMELPNGWDEPGFQWPRESESAIRVDVGARNPEEAALLGIKVSDTITVPKEYRTLLGGRANGRSFDDRVGCAALLSAVRSLDGPLKNRDVTFVWSTGEELGLLGADALAKRLSTGGRAPDTVFAVDTFVSSDSPLETTRFADAELGRGFVVRAIDSSNIAPLDAVQRVMKIARANQIPAQFGVTAGGNDGSVFLPYGATDVALGWPLRYAHSPGEVIDTRDSAALARIVAAIAKSW